MRKGSVLLMVVRRLAVNDGEIAECVGRRDRRQMRQSNRLPLRMRWAFNTSDAVAIRRRMLGPGRRSSGARFATALDEARSLPPN